MHPLSNPLQIHESHSKKSTRSANLRPLRHYSSVAKYPLKSFCFVWLIQKVESPYPLDSNPQSNVTLIRSWLIYFANRFKTFALDTSLRINATLSMTRWGVDSRILDLQVWVGASHRRFALPKASLAMTLNSNDSHKSSRFIVRDDFKL